eukprot:CAMPEP_0177277606 /NCGR_PEP_ID=MMETSP0367-20130122/68879_1 /TAXON_ID=447022 ORGANISM="Scrippsiella hangoei-like, Strain SHHI-4" /NCGR_SAMPLE_ID=MMETSP0367 /ASSEMBLY_ACC=CAM_ASM_000362 /LENGTH=30 /DNA_ID= /DNA_START= /DNA_END= /DNA_ORIENTATION=
MRRLFGKQRPRSVERQDGKIADDSRRADIP